MKRYRLVLCGNTAEITPSPYMEESPKGHWVQYDDVKRLRAENDALRKSIPKIKADAVREALNYGLREAYCGDDVIDMAYEYANKLQSQAAKGE